LALAIPLGALVALVALTGCGAGGVRTACVAGSSSGAGAGACVAGEPRGTSTTVSSGSLTATLALAPAVAKAGSAVTLELTASTPHAAGALGYLVRFGDGATSGSSAVPQFCIAGAAPPAHRVWRLEHRYRARGTYPVSASVYINCTRDRASVATRVLVK
jgi:hypothetical protein